MPRDEIIEINKLYLNQKNYRIDYVRYNTLEKVVERLYLDEDIIGMIEGIVRFQGIYPHERLIVLPRSSSEYVVIEGNRRVLAIKSILGTIEPPAKYKRNVLSLASKLSDDAKESLKHVNAVVFDIDDERYLKIIADKHSTVNYQRWGQISQWHFFADLYESNNRDIDLTASDLGKNRSEVMSYIRFHSTISYIRSLPYWDENDQRDQIESNKLKATKFTRPLGFKMVRDALNLKWDEKLEVKPDEADLDKYNEVLCKYAEASLILDKSEDDYIFTRSAPEEIRELIGDWKKQFDQSRGGPMTPPAVQTRKGRGGENRGNAGGSGKNNGPKPRTDDDNKKSSKHEKPAVYFENLKCTIGYNRLRILSTELIELSKNNRMEKFPAAGMMLTRALFESCLNYLLDKKGKRAEYHKSLEHEKNGKIYVTKEGLSNLLSFVLKNAEYLFKNENLKNAKKALEQVKAYHLDALNLAVHDSWLDPTTDKIKGIAGDIRELLRAILTDDA